MEANRLICGEGPTMAEAIEAAGKVHVAEGWTDVCFVGLTQTATGWMAVFTRRVASDDFKATCLGQK